MLATDSTQIAAPTLSSVAAFKAARRKQLDDADAPRKAANAATLQQLTAKLSAAVGAEVMSELTVTLKSATPQVLTVTAKRHVPVDVLFAGDTIKFSVLVGIGRKSFDHLADAFERGQPKIDADAQADVVRKEKATPLPKSVTAFNTVAPVIRQKAAPTTST